MSSAEGVELSSLEPPALAQRARGDAAGARAAALSAGELEGAGGQHSSARWAWDQVAAASSRRVLTALRASSADRPFVASAEAQEACAPRAPRSDVQERVEQLQAVAELCVVLGGFAMSAFIELGWYSFGAPGQPANPPAVRCWRSFA